MCKKLQIFQNKSVRFITDMGNRTSVNFNVLNSIGFFKDLYTKAKQILGFLNVENRV